MKIQIEFIAHSAQRYSTVGDWYFDTKGDLQIRVSKMHAASLEWLVAVHELAEALMCTHRGISDKEIDKFDIGWHSTVYPEPGEDPSAPYHQEHMTAELMERLMAKEMGIDWIDYTKAVESL